MNVPARTSRFLIGLVIAFATHGIIPVVLAVACARYTRGGTPTSSEKRVLNVPSEEHPTVKQTSVTERSLYRSNAMARSIRRVIR